MHHLQICVEQVAAEFEKLEEDIINTYEKIKAELYENVFFKLFSKPKEIDSSNSILQWSKIIMEILISKLKTIFSNNHPIT
jgi:hypothetical protein